MQDKIKNIISKLAVNQHPLPVCKKELEIALNNLVDILFYCNDRNTKPAEQKLTEVYQLLENNISKLNVKNTKEVVDKFFDSLITVQGKLLEDAKTFVENDPAAKSVEEVIITYPGFYALEVYRLSHELYKLNVPVVPRLFSEYAHSKVGVDIHPGAIIGKNCFLDHGTGIVIGETCIIGNNVKIYQGVTLGALHVKKISKQKRHPTVEDNVVIYAGATILGGETTIGHNSTIGGNSWITNSVKPFSLVQNNAEIEIKDKKNRLSN